MTTTSTLQAAGIVRQYDKFTVLGDADLRVVPDIVHFVIRPNGTDKIALFHTLTGTRMITSNTIVFDDHDMTREIDYQRVQRGIARSSQVTGPSPSPSVYENLRLATFGTTLYRILHGWHLPQGELTYIDMADRVPGRFELPYLADAPAVVLSHDQQRRPKASMVLVVSPCTIFLDEPASGMDTDDLSVVKTLIHGLVQDHTVMLVEHSMNIMVDISGMTTVMRQGKMLMEGMSDAVRTDPHVCATYLSNMIMGGRA